MISVRVMMLILIVRITTEHIRLTVI